MDWINVNCIPTGKFHTKSSSKETKFNHPPQNFFSFWPLIDTPKLWWTANFETQQKMGTLSFKPAKIRPWDQKRALATRRDGATPCYKSATFGKSFQFLALKIAPSKFFCSRNPKINIRKLGKVIFYEFWAHLCVATAFPGSPNRT